MSSNLFCASVIYPFKEGEPFDFDQYTNKLIPEYIALIGGNCVNFEIRRFLPTPDGSAPAFLCLTNVWFTSMDDFGACVSTPAMKELMERIDKVTSIKPIRQLDSVISH